MAKKNFTFDFSKLRGRIIEKYGSDANFAEALGILPQQLSPKLTGKTGITKAEIVEWCRLLDIAVEEIGVYFFVPKV